MSFVIDVNPFQGILCNPYYHVLVLILFSWFSWFIESLFSRFIGTYYYYIRNNTPCEPTIRLTSDEFTERALQVLLHHFPDDVAFIILSFIEFDEDEFYEALCKEKENKLNRKLNLFSCLHYVYPTARILANIICFIIVMLRYSKWYHNAAESSNWTKYCGLIWTFFYLPIFKAKGLLRALETYLLGILYLLIFYDLRRLKLAEIIIDAVYIIFVTLISFPLFISGLIIFIPTVIIIVLFECLLLCLFGMVNNYWLESREETLGIVYSR